MVPTLIEILNFLIFSVLVIIVSMQEQRSYSASLRFELESIETNHKGSGMETREVS